MYIFFLALLCDAVFICVSCVFSPRDACRKLLRTYRSAACWQPRSWRRNMRRRCVCFLCCVSWRISTDFNMAFWYFDLFGICFNYVQFNLDQFGVFLHVSLWDLDFFEFHVCIANSPPGNARRKTTRTLRLPPPPRRQTARVTGQSWKPSRKT